MKTTKKFTLTGAVVIFTAALISWNHADYSTKEWSTHSWSYLHDENSLGFTEAEINSFDTDDNWNFSPESNRKQIYAEDVLIQKIPGDNNHLLMMAFFSKENFSGPIVTLNNGSGIVFRDDGTGFDKKAGDGLYTAQITADVKEFRKQAVSISVQMKKANYKPVHFIHRMMVQDPDALDSFELQKFDANQAVSLSGLNDALSSNISTTSTVTHGLSSNISTNSISTVTADAAATVSSIRQNSMFITNLNVVEDPTRTWNFCNQTGNVDGPWTFWTLMKELASKDPLLKATDAQVSTFVQNWLNTWKTTQVINADSVKSRLVNNIMGAWLTQSRNGGAPSGQLDKRFAPFKLTAIVNRFDLRDGALNGIPGSPCGEGRFVFCLIKSDCSRAASMTVIFEYGINKPATCDGQKAWAQQWVNLTNFPLGSSEYNQALQNVTDQFSLCGTNISKPNQSSLDQLRTNEIALSPNPKAWELREFVLDGNTGNLKETTVGQTVADKYNAQVVNADVQRIVDYVNTNAASISSETNVVPPTWNGEPFLGGSSRILGAPTGNPPQVYHFDGTDATSASTFIKSTSARFFFSFNNCSGCHSGEVQTNFTHVDPVFFGTPATLSGFVTGTAGSGGAIDFDNNPTNDTFKVKDAALRPASDPKIRNFNEIRRRAVDLRKIAVITCGSVLGIATQLTFEPLNSVD